MGASDGRGNQNRSADQALSGLACHQAVSRDGLEGSGPRRTFRSLEKLSGGGRTGPRRSSREPRAGESGWVVGCCAELAARSRTLVGIRCVYK